MSGDLAFDLRKTCERFVPARLQFTCHETICRVGGVILPEGAIGRIACGLEIAL